MKSKKKFKYCQSLLMFIRKWSNTIKHKISVFNKKSYFFLPISSNFNSFNLAYIQWHNFFFSHTLPESKYTNNVELYTHQKNFHSVNSYLFFILKSNNSFKNF